MCSLLRKTRTEVGCTQGKHVLRGDILTEYEMSLSLVVKFSIYATKIDKTLVSAHQLMAQGYCFKKRERIEPSLLRYTYLYLRILRCCFLLHSVTTVYQHLIIISLCMRYTY